MKVLIACEFSGTVRDAFRRRGHDAWSCDLLPSETEGNHLQCDIRELKNAWGYGMWDLLIAFPPCTYLCSSGARWWKGKAEEQVKAIEFCRWIMNQHTPRIAMENPIGILSTVYCKPDQIIQPWQFGHGETKSICLWLKNLPLLISTHIVEGRYPRVYREPPSPERWRNRSRTYSGIAEAMAEQWGSLDITSRI